MSLPSDKANAAPAPRTTLVQRQSMNIYTVLLILSLLSIVVACIFLAIEMSAYNWDIKANDSRVSQLAPVVEVATTSISNPALTQHG